MSKESHFMKGTLGDGFQIDELRELDAKLTKSERKKLKKIIARISEASYRRGAQQALWVDKENRWFNDKAREMVISGEHRYGITLDKSPALEGPRVWTRTSLDVLDTEYGIKLHNLGLWL